MYLHHILNKIKRSEIILSVMTLSLGTIVSQAIPIFASLILARLYSPVNYGDWGIFSSYAAIFTVFICGKYEYAILRPKRTIDALHLCCLSFLIGLSISLVLYVILLLFFLIDFSYVINIKGIRWLPVFIFMNGILQILINYANRQEKYKAIAFSSVCRSCVQAISRISLGFGQIHSGLIYGALLGLVSGCICLAKNIFSRRLVNAISWVQIKKLIVEYKKFPLYEAPSGLLNVLSTNIPLLFLSYFFVKEYVGYFSMAVTILYMPMSFIGIALGQIFYKKACIWNDTKQIADLALKMFRLTFWGGCIPVVFLVLFGQDIFALLLGPHWKMTGEFATYLSIWLWLVLCFSPLSTIFLVKDKQRLGMILNGIMLILRVLAVVIGGYIFQSIFITVIMYGVVGIIVWLIEGMYIWNLTKMKMSSYEYIYMCALFSFLLLVWMN